MTKLSSTGALLLLASSESRSVNRTRRSLKSAVDDHLLDVSAPEKDRETATPFFFHIHKTAGSTLHDYFGFCLNLTVAAEVGITGGHDTDTELSQVVIDGRKYINVDTSTVEGLERAHKLGFQNIGHVAEVVISPLFLPAVANLFTKSNKAMMFTLFRHPVDRSISMFFYLQKATWEPTYTSKWANMTLMDYIQSDIVEDNWVVRFLVGKPDGLVGEHDLEEAKRILSDKCWIGLQTRLEEALLRFGELFGWNRLPKWGECIAKYRQGYMRWSNSNPNKVPIDRDGTEWQMLSQINALDLKLFAHAHILYKQQGETFFPQYQQA